MADAVLVEWPFAVGALAAVDVSLETFEPTDLDVIDTTGAIRKIGTYAFEDARIGTRLWIPTSFGLLEVERTGAAFDVLRSRAFVVSESGDITTRIPLTTRAQWRAGAEADGKVLVLSSDVGPWRTARALFGTVLACAD